MRFQWGFLRRPHRRANDEMEGTRTCFVSRQDRKELSASEVGDYAFCARTWYLRRVLALQPETDEIQAGTAAHEAAGGRIVEVVVLEWLVKVLAWTSAGIAATLIALQLAR
jgi:hypothetical protein